MAESIAQIGNAAHVAGLYAERNGDLVEAARQYRIAWKAASAVSETEKDGLRFSPGSLADCIRDIDVQIARAAGHGKVKRVNIAHCRPTTCDCDC
jgi:hypothetical protein